VYEGQRKDINFVNIFSSSEKFTFYPFLIDPVDKIKATVNMDGEEAADIDFSKTCIMWSSNEATPSN
jgi:hypothetical protein